MKLLPRSWYFYYGRARLYRRLYACAKVLALIAGVTAIVYWNRPEMSPLRPIPAPQRMESFSNCGAARAAGRAPLHRGEPGYSPQLDRDGDGIACEPWRRRS
jgi:Excalibur calcium-binding domain